MFPLNRTICYTSPAEQRSSVRCSRAPWLAPGVFAPAGTLRPVAVLGAAVALLAGAMSTGSRPARADVFVLKNGGEVHGEWLNAKDPASKGYLILTEQGATITLAAEQVIETRQLSETQRDYLQRLPRLPDTVDNHWRAAEWCRERKLSAERADHLERIIELEPDHAAARRGLGYMQTRGKWVLPDDYQAQQGYTKYEGRYRTEQEVLLLQERAAQKAKKIGWELRVRRLREDLAMPDRVSEAVKQLRAIDDPEAIAPLEQLLKSERHRAVKLLLIDILAKLDVSRALAALVACSLRDADEEVFHACLERIVKRKRPEVTTAYVQGLRHPNNVVVNRAAYALGKLEDRSALEALIEALRTRHALVSPATRPGSADSIHASFSPTGNGGAATPFGGTGMTMGTGAQASIVEVPNQRVLDALVQLSGGASFGFDQRAWHAWLAAENRSQAPTLLK